MGGKGRNQTALTDNWIKACGLDVSHSGLPNALGWTDWATHTPSPMHTIRGPPVWVRSHGIQQKADQNKPVLWTGSSRREWKVEGAGNHIRQSNKLHPPPPLVGRNYLSDGLRTKPDTPFPTAKTTSIIWVLSQQGSGEPQTGVMMLSLQRTSPGPCDRPPREAPSLTGLGCPIRKQGGWGFHVVHRAGGLCSARKKGTHTALTWWLGPCLARRESVPKFLTKWHWSHSREQVREWPHPEGQMTAYACQEVGLL